MNEKLSKKTILFITFELYELNGYMQFATGIADANAQVQLSKFHILPRYKHSVFGLKIQFATIHYSH